MFFLKGRFHWLFHGLIIINLLTQCGEEQTKPPKINSDSEKEYTLNDYNIKDFRYESYSYDEKAYKFLNKNEITPSDINIKLFHRVYYDKKSAKIKRIDEMKVNKLIRYTLLFYDDKGLISASESYVGNKRLERKGIYKNNILVSRHKFDFNGNIQNKSAIKYLKVGIEERWFNTKGQLSHTIFYDRNNKLLRYAKYKNEYLKTIVDLMYNKEGLIISEEYFDKLRRYIKSRVFKYDDDGNIKIIYTYVKEKLLTMSKYDSLGRETRIEKYGKGNVVKSYAIFKYKEEGKVERWYDKFDQVISFSKFNSNNFLVKRSKYKNETEIYREEHRYENSRRKESLFYFNQKLALKSYYNSKGFKQKDEKIRNGNLVSYITYKYNDKLPISLSTHHNAKGMVTKIWKYFYNKKGQVYREDLFLGKKVVLKNLVLKNFYTYDSKGYIKKEYVKGYLTAVMFFNKMGWLNKKENYVKSKIRGSIRYRYNKKGQVVQEELYDRLGGLDKTVTMFYNERGFKNEESAFDRNNQYLGSIYYIYDRKNRLTHEEHYNWLKEKVKDIEYDKYGRGRDITNKFDEG